MSKSDYTLHATMIGTFSVTLNNKVVCNSSDVTHQIMARLLLDPVRGYSYKQLAQDIHDEDPDQLPPTERKKCLNKTRKAVQRLRDTLGTAGKHLLPDASKNGDVLKLELGGVAFSSDVERFEALVVHCKEDQIEACQEILTVYRGRLLPDFPPHTWLDILRDNLDDKRDRIERHYQQTLLRYINDLIRGGGYQRNMEARQNLCEWMALLVEIPTFQKSRHFDVVNGKLLELSQKTTEYLCQRVSDSDFAGAVDKVSQPKQADAEAHPPSADATEALTTANESALLSRCSIFKRAWSMEAAQAVCKSDGIDVAAVIGTLCRNQALRLTL